MTRLVLAALLTSLALLGPAAAQNLPYEIPKPLGGPIIGLDGKEIKPVGLGPSAWSGGFELGLSGNEGNSQVLKLFTGAELLYDSPEDSFLLYGWYALTRQHSTVLENNGLLLARNELPFADSLAWYVQGQVEYDEFRAADFRVAAHNGVSYTYLRSNDMFLKFRAGLGTSKELDGPRNEWLPEAQFGFDFWYRITERSRFSVAADYYPDVHDFGNYRVRGRASFDVLIDPDLCLLLRLGVLERYDSRPQGSKRNDLDYFATLVLQF
jgi:Protein of unknown function, DUF481